MAHKTIPDVAAFAAQEAADLERPGKATRQNNGKRSLLGGIFQAHKEYVILLQLPWPSTDSVVVALVHILVTSSRSYAPSRTRQILRHHFSLHKRVERC